MTKKEETGNRPSNRENSPPEAERGESKHSEADHPVEDPEMNGPASQEWPNRPPGDAASEVNGGNEDVPGTAGAETDTGPNEESPLDALATELEAARADIAAHQDRYMRLQAEMENYKRRTSKEHEERLKYALTPLVKEIAAVMDNLERAVEHARQNQGEPADALRDGIEMVIKQMIEAFSRCGVTRIEAEGKPFDPNLHEAMTVVETDDHPEDQVVMVLQAGYLLHERVVRPARVGVAKKPTPA